MTEQQQILLTCSSSGGAWDLFEDKGRVDWFKSFDLSDLNHDLNQATHQKID